MNRLIGQIRTPSPICQTWGALALACLLASGCTATTAAHTNRDESRLETSLVTPDPLPVQQVRAYGEAVTGLFVSLADFEDSSNTAPGYQQVDYFAVVEVGAPNAAHRVGEPLPAAGKGSGGPLSTRPGTEEEGPTTPPKAERKFVVNITRTGAGAMEVTLPVGTELAFRLPYPRDFGDYTLLSMALYLEAIRDDLEVTLVSDSGRRRCHPTLLQTGWNNVLLDIQGLSSAPQFDAKSVREIHIAFPHAGAPVTFNLDDILLIDNRRDLPDTPAGAKVRVSGLDYEVSLPLWNRKFTLARCQDGLWRLGADQAVIELVAPGGQAAGKGERTDLMGGRKIGRVELLECNPVRVRLASTWYFPPRSGEWVSLDVAQIRWEYTFYGDGRWVTHVMLNDDTGGEVGSMRMLPAPQAVWSAGKTGELVVQPFTEPVGHWSYLMAPPGGQCQAMQQAYASPPPVMPLLAAQGTRAPGDTDGDGFDQSQGCYLLAARAGNCRFSAPPAPAAACWPVFRVAGPWPGPVSVTCAGAAIRDVVTLPDGSILFALPGSVAAPLCVEVVGLSRPAPAHAPGLQR